MGITKTRDGRYLVGQGVTDGNEYKGSLAWRDIVIQLSADGATAESIEKLEFLRDYGLYHSGEGNSVMPPSVSVWISNNGTTTAVEADDITVDGSNYTICGIKWDGSAWDFSQAGQGGGGGGGLPPYTSADKGKVLTVGEDEEHPEQLVIYQGGGTLIDAEFTLTGAEAALNALPVNDPITVSVTANGVNTVCDTWKTSDNEFLLTDLGANSAIYKNGDVYTFWSQDLADGSSVTVEIYKVSPRYTIVWEGVHKVVEASATYTNGVTQMMTDAITEILTSGGTKTASYQHSAQIVTDEDAAAIENMCENWPTAPATFYAIGNYFTPIVVANHAVQITIPCYIYQANNVSYCFSVKIVTNATFKSVTMVVVFDVTDSTT